MFAAASACGGSPRAPAGPEALDRLGEIRIVGNRAIARDTLVPALALHEAIGDGAAIDPYLLGLDTERIRAAYIKRGFFAVTVTPSVETRRSGAQVVVFTVVEGRRAATRVEITGLPPEVGAARARALVELGDGAPFDYDAYDAAKAPLVAMVEDAGYARAEVRGRVTADATGAVAIARYDVAPGPRCTFGAIRITGVARPDLVTAVRARLPFATGDRYASSSLAEAQAELYQLGRFSTVRVVAERGGDGAVVAVAVELAEATRHEVHAGFGLGYEPATYEARVRGGGSLVPAAAPLVTLATDARVALTLPHDADTADVEPKLRLYGTVQRMDLWRPRLRGEIEAGVDYQTVEAFTWAGLHLRVGLASPIGPRWLQARVGWLFEQLTFDNFVPELDGAAGMAARQALGLDGSPRHGAYQASLIADLRDDPIEPHRGVYAAVSGSRGAELAGGDLRYWQVVPELRGYVSVAGVVVAARARLGAIVGDAPGDVPVTERYFSGGTSGQRGFSERFLAPRVDAALGCADAGGTVIGGAGLIETGVELRRQIASLGGVPLGTTVFLDGADVACRPQELALRRLQWAVGAGIWGKLAGLKVHTDLGYRLNSGDRPAGPSAFDEFAWHIGVGETY